MSSTIVDRVFEVTGRAEVVTCDRCSAVAPNKALDETRSIYAQADLAGWGEVRLFRDPERFDRHKRYLELCEKCCEAVNQFIGKAASK